MYFFQRSRRGLRALVACAALCVVAACSSTQHAQVLSDEAVVLDLPMVEQDEMYACGLQSISALSAYWGLSLSEPEQERLALLAEREKGLSGEELCTALETAGFEAFLFHGQLDRSDLGVLAQIDAGRPVLVMIAPKRDTHHYVLLLGYDEPRRSVCLLDPVRGRVIVPYETFQRGWDACERFTLLAVPKDTQAAASSEGI